MSSRVMMGFQHGAEVMLGDLSPTQLESVLAEVTLTLV